ncbi:MAG: lysylphosphatidylglycerol synthase transmembrane domain-containing protein, partial [Bacteroidota bacterium]
MEIQKSESRPKLSKRRNRLMQAVILVAAYGFIYHQVFSEHGNNQLNGLLQEFITLGNEKILAAIIFGLMFFNWGIESAKWKYIIARIEKVSYFQAFKAILTGITISTFTPNRVGEYFGRAFILKKAHPIDAIILTIVGSMSQLLVTVITGSTSLLFLLPQFEAQNYKLPGFVTPGLFILLILINAGFFILYLNIGAIRPLARYFLKRHWRKVYRYISVIGQVHPKELLTVLLYSAVRYCIFFLQFYLALRLFGVRLSLKEAMMLLPVIYLTL